MGDTGARKGDARDDRLSLRKTNEEVLRKKLSIEAQNICADECKQFGECAKKSGLLVVFKCRSENLASKLLDVGSLLVTYRSHVSISNVFTNS